LGLRDETRSSHRRPDDRPDLVDLRMSINPSKALIALVALICMTVLLAVKAIETDQGLPIITMIVGYSVGNGMAAITGKQVDPIIKKKEPK
jgi:hypothetical protein